MPSRDPARRLLQTQAAAATRHNLPTRDDLRRRLAAERLRDYITRIVDEAPPLTPQERAKLAELLIVRNVAPSSVT